MTIEELRDKYSTLEKDYSELKIKYDEQVDQNKTVNKRVEELESYNRKLFNDYVLSKDEPVKSSDKEENQLDNIINKMKENYK